LTATLDANVLLYASDESSPFHQRARDLLQEIANGPDIVYVFWPTVMAYLRIATHPAIFARPLSLAVAIGNVDSLARLSHIQMPGEQDRFWQRFREVALEADARSNLVPDAHLVGLMRENGVGSIWTHDRDYRRFPAIDVRDPFE
jgi:uncharacterized protein